MTWAWPWAFIGRRSGTSGDVGSTNCVYAMQAPALTIGDAMGRDPRHTYYQVLMLAENADAEIISAVYRKLAQRFHPDVDTNREAARRMAEINEAYSTLRDADRRREYDAWLAARRDRRRNDRLILQPGDVPFGEAGPPPGPPQGSVIDFGRYRGWSLGQIRRRDPEFLEWLVRAPGGRQYREEIKAILGH